MNQNPPTDEVDADTVAQRAAQVITNMGADIRVLTAERDRYRIAWQSARFRAQAYGEGILRIVEDRESYQEWLKQEQAVTQQLRIELAATRTKTLTVEADEIVAHCPDHGSKDGVWMDCHCAVADDMRRRTATPAPAVSGGEQ